MEDILPVEDNCELLLDEIRKDQGFLNLSRLLILDTRVDGRERGLQFAIAPDLHQVHVLFADTRDQVAGGSIYRVAEFFTMVSKFLVSVVAIGERDHVGIPEIGVLPPPLTINFHTHPREIFPSPTDIMETLKKGALLEVIGFVTDNILVCADYSEISEEDLTPFMGLTGVTSEYIQLLQEKVSMNSLDLDTMDIGRVALEVTAGDEARGVSPHRRMVITFPGRRIILIEVERGLRTPTDIWIPGVHGKRMDPCSEEGRWGYGARYKWVN